jgi:hypothetical protein
MRRSEENIDLMIFDYLEGNMTMEEQLDFEANAAVDALLKEELEIWQSTYIASEIPDTGVLESALIQKPSPFSSFTFYLNTLLIIAVSFISNTQIEREFNAVQIMDIPSIELVKRAPTYFKEENGRYIPVIHKVDMGDKTASEEIDELPLESNQASLMILSTRALNFDEYLINPIETVKISGVEYTFPKEQKKMDRKQLRQLKKMRNKAARQRRAYEFMQGDVPYVVPIDTRNF